MARKDYYLILGVARSETPSGIRSRYRELVRTLHPDVAGAQSAGAFREIAEAYQVLADPAARRRHNIELAAAGERRPRIAPVAPWRVAPISELAEPPAVRPSFEALVDRLGRNFTGPGVPTGERPEGLTFEVVLTPEEALQGGSVPIGVPGVVHCPECDGTGRVLLFPCVPCGARGVVVAERMIRVPLPPRVRRGSVVEVPLGRLGIQNVYLRLHVRIE
jgi:hypothetical protein